MTPAGDGGDLGFERDIGPMFRTKERDSTTAVDRLQERIDAAEPA